MGQKLRLWSLAFLVLLGTLGIGAGTAQTAAAASDSCWISAGAYRSSGYTMTGSAFYGCYNTGSRPAASDICVFNRVTGYIVRCSVVYYDYTPNSGSWSYTFNGLNPTASYGILAEVWTTYTYASSSAY